MINYVTVEIIKYEGDTAYCLANAPFLEGDAKRKWLQIKLENQSG